MLYILPVIVLAWALLAAPAQAQFTQQGPKLFGTGAVGNADQGISVSLSGDENTAIVGGRGDNGIVGAAWVFTRSGSVWSQQAKLVGTGAVGLAAQGISVSISADGNTTIVGGGGDNNLVGAAWVFTRSGSVWSQQAKLVGTGSVGASQQSAVSLSGDGNTAIVGGPADNNLAGAAWVYTRSDGVWSQQAKLVGTGALGNAEQGFAVSLSGDGNTAIVGGPADNNGAGAAWVYTRSDGVWSQQAILVGTGEQGLSVSLSGDGNTALVGRPFEGAAGAASVYTRSGGVWSQQATLVGAGAVGDPEQGFSASLSGDGNTALVGGVLDNNAVGAAWVFTRSGSVWSEQAKLVGTGAVGAAFQGSSVSLAGNGNIAIVGGPADNIGAGAAWVFAKPVFAGTPGKTNCFGQSVSALAHQFGGLYAAAKALEFPNVPALQDAILAFCEG
jgi:hypothetical protein